MQVLKKSVVNLKEVPVPALVLGFAGLIPFVALVPPIVSMLPLPVYTSTSMMMLK